MTIADWRFASLKKLVSTNPSLAGDEQWKGLLAGPQRHVYYVLLHSILLTKASLIYKLLILSILDPCSKFLAVSSACIYVQD